MVAALLVAAATAVSIMCHGDTPILLVDAPSCVVLRGDSQISAPYKIENSVVFQLGLRYLKQKDSLDWSLAFGAPAMFIADKIDNRRSQRYDYRTTL